MTTITHGCVIGKVHLSKIIIKFKIMIFILNFRAGGTTCGCVFWEIRKHKVYRTYVRTSVRPFTVSHPPHLP